MREGAKPSSERSLNIALAHPKDALRLPPFLRALLRVLLSGLIVLSLFRATLLFLHTGQWKDAPAVHVSRALFDRGLLFDLYVLAWMLSLPTLLLGTAYLLKSPRRWPVTMARWCFMLPFIALLLFACADIPFYDYLNMRLTRVALTLAATPSQSLKELVSTPIYLAALVMFVMSAWMCMRIIGRVLREVPSVPTDPLWRRITFLLVPLVALFFCVRGTFNPDDQPLMMEDAYFCETPFLNQLGPNATFTFLDSYARGSPELMPVDEAIAHVRRLLDIPEARYTSPIARDVTFATAASPMNVVLILVESLSANRLKRFGHPKDLMPFLGTLMDSAIVYDHFYSAGTRTCNGIFSSLYGLPAVFEEHPFSHPSMTAQRFHGLPQILKEHGYRTDFFYPGDPAFDNMKGFLPNNGFDRLFGEDDYPDSLYRNSWGVTDHALYGMVLHQLDRRPDPARPFLATIMTISSHVGYNVPDDITGFAATSDRDDESIYEYADAALEGFFAEATKKAWFPNTLFVITGDHGQRFDPLHEVPLSYHHVPLIILDPRDRAARTDHRFSTQVDIPETTLGLLCLPHVNNTLGIDLTRSSRACAYFCSDARIAALDDRFYWIRTGAVEHLYDLASHDTQDRSGSEKAALFPLKTCAESMTACMRHLVDNRLVGPPVPR